MFEGLSLAAADTKGKTLILTAAFNACSQCLLRRTEAFVPKLSPQIS